MYISKIAAEISLAARSEELVDHLTPFLQGRVSRNWAQHASDDEVIAVIMGWFYRALGIVNNPYSKVVTREFNWRINLLGPDGDPTLGESYMKSGLRGLPARGAGTLVVAALEVGSYDEFISRVIVACDLVPESTILRKWPKRLSIESVTMSDQLLFDLRCLDIAIQSNEPLSDDLLQDALNQLSTRIMARGEVLLESDFVFDAVCDGEDQFLELLEALGIRRPHVRREPVIWNNPELQERRNRAIYRHNNRIDSSDSFWTNDRVQAVLELGME
jgi:hypothetical protein